MTVSVEEKRVNILPMTVAPEQRVFISTNEANIELDNLLQSGEITPDIIEVFQIATVTDKGKYNIETPEQSWFESYMQTIVDRLLQSNFAQQYLLRGDPIPTFRYFITDHGDNLNAAIAKAAQPPIILVTKALLFQYMQDGREDLLAGVIAHELTHYFLDSERNSKIEEGIAYGLPRFMLYYAEYQHTGLQEAYDQLPHPSGFGQLSSYIDEHPGLQLSKRIIEDSAGFLAQHLRRTQPNFKQIAQADSTSIPSELKEIVESMSYTNEIEQDFKDAQLLTRSSKWVKDAYGREKVVKETQEDTNRKVTFIYENLDKWLDKTGKIFGPFGRYYRAHQLNGIMNSSFNYHAEVRTTSTQRDPLFNKIITEGLPLNCLYDYYPKDREIAPHEGYYEQYYTNQKPPEYGALQDIQNALNNVFACVTSESVDYDSTATVCQNLIDACLTVKPWFRKNILKHFYFGDIPGLPTLEDYKGGQVYELWKKRVKAIKAGKKIPEGFVPPWENLVQLAITEYSEKKQTLLADTLLLLGIVDPRLYDVPAVNPTVRDGGEYSYMRVGLHQNVELDEDGKIIGAYRFSSDESESEHYDLYQKKRGELTVKEHRMLWVKGRKRKLLEMKQKQEMATLKLWQVTAPEELNKLFDVYRYQFAPHHELMGGQLDPHTGNIIGAEAALELAYFFDERIADDPDTWIPVAKAFFTQKFTDRDYPHIPQTGLHISYHDLGPKTHHLDSTFQRKFRKGDDPRMKDNYGQVTDTYAYGEEVGLSLRHPYVQFMLSHTEGFVEDARAIFSAEELLSVLDTTVSYQRKTLEGENIDQPVLFGRDLYNNIIADSDVIQSEIELADRLRKLRSLHPTIVRTKGVRVPNQRFPKYVPYEPGEWASSFLIHHARRDVYDYLQTSTDATLGIDAFKECLQVAQARVYAPGTYTSTLLKQEILQLLDNQFLRNVDSDLQIAHDDPLLVAQSYVLYETNGYFTKHPESRWDDGYDRLVREQLQILKRDKQRYPELRQFTETLLYSCSIPSAEVRHDLVQGWAEAIKAQYGIDTTPTFDDIALHPELQGYYDEMYTLTAQVLEKTTDRDAIATEMLTALADSLQTQSALTREIYFKKSKRSKQELLESTAGGKGMMGEFSLDFIVQDSDTRLGTIDFLTKELSEESLEEYVEIYKERLERDDNLKKLIGHPSDRDNDVSYYRSRLSDYHIRNQVKSRFRAAHENFWSGRTEVRAYYMNLLAFPAEQKDLMRRKGNEIPPHEELMNYVIEKVLPYDTDSVQDSEFNTYTSFGRDLIYSYLDGANEAEQRLLLSGLMVSAKQLDKVTVRDELSIGKALGLVLMNMGPAGVKLAQAIHSYPQTPLAIRNGMDGVKGEANMPNRNQLFEGMEASIEVASDDPNKLTLQNIAHVGKILGAGAYQYTAEGHLYNPLHGETYVAITELRDNIYIFAQNEFEHIESTLESFVKRRAARGETVTSDMLDAMRKIVHQASASSLLETNYDIGYTQANLLRPSYEGLAIRANNINVHFDTVQWLDHGIRSESGNAEDLHAYKVATVARGKSFNRFIRTASEDEIKALSMALQFSEDLLMLSGKHFDHDRHGENFHVLRIKKDTQIGQKLYKKGDLYITHYDLGAVNLAPPTTVEKQILGNIIGSLIKSVQQGETDAKSLLIEKLTAVLQTNHDTSGYLASVLRGILARGDFLRHLKPVDLQEIVLAEFASGVIDPTIKKAILRELNIPENTPDVVLRTLLPKAKNISITAKSKGLWN
ncbi:MAG: hypothetical protein ACEQSA_02230 [Weeksellaceae bacterium]